MKQKHGNNIYNTFLLTVGLSKGIFDENNNIFNISLKECIDFVNKANTITDVLNYELILTQNLDINNHNNSEKKIDNRVNLYNMALEEYELFYTNKDEYLNKISKRNIFNPKGIDINKDTIFEQSIKKLIVGLGTEKNASTVSAQMFELYETRQNKLKQICQDFSKERKEFLS